MSETTAIPDVRARVAERKAPRGKSFTDHALVQLTIVRFRETLREPEALFWIFAFPILLAAGLGIAFRNRPAEVLKIATVASALTQSLEHEKLLAVVQLDSNAAEEALIDQTVFALNSKTYAEFIRRLDQPPRSNDRLRRALETPAPWEK